MKTINNITIIGWWWNFWRFMKIELEKVWFQVFTILEDTTDEKKQEILDNSDVIIFSVSIRNTIEIIKNMVNFKLNPDTLVMDVTWLKTWINDELENLWTKESVSIHPMFWPSTKSLQWKNLVQTSSDQKWWKKWKILRRLLNKCSLNNVKLSESEHDFNMAFVQASPHFLNLVFWNIIAWLWVWKDDLKFLNNSTLLPQKTTFLRILNWQNWSTFADMEILNPEFKDDLLNKLLNSMEKVIKTKVKIIDENTWKNRKETKLKAISKLLWLVFKKLIELEHIDLNQLKILSTPNFDDLLKLVNWLNNDEKIELTKKDLQRFIKEFQKLAFIVQSWNSKWFEDIFRELQERFL